MLIRSFSVLALLLLTGPANADPMWWHDESYRPSPSAGKLTDPQQTNASNRSNAPNTEQRGTNETPLVVKIAPADDAQEKAARTEKERQEKAAADRRSEITTDIIALAAAAQAGALIITIFIMMRNGRRQLRAYLLVESVLFAKPETKNGARANWRIHIILKNSGQTPAYSAIVTATREIGAPKPDDALLPLPADAEISPPALVPPGGIHIVSLAGLSHGITDFVSNRTAGNRAYAWGHAEYLDTFGKRHFTNFQMVSTFGQIHQFAYCNRGNDTDDQFWRWWRWWPSRST